MLKKSKWRVTTDTASFLSILCLGFMFLNLDANCHSAKSGGSSPDTPRLNWLDRPGWDTIVFKSSPTTQAGINLEKRKLSIYIRGCLAQWVAEHPDSAKYVVEEINFMPNNGTSPQRYTVTAFLKPNAKRITEDPNDPHGHLIPSEPDPPGGSQ